MAVLLNDLCCSEMKNEEALAFSDKTIPIYGEAFGTNPFLQQLISTAIERKTVLNDFLKRNKKSPHTPSVRKSDKSRETLVLSLVKQLEANLGRTKLPELVSNSHKLLDIVKVKLPSFSTAKDHEQTALIDGLEFELAKPENAGYAEAANVKEILDELIEANNNYKNFSDQRTSEKSVKVSRTRDNLMNLLDIISTIHDVFGWLMEFEPGQHDSRALKINEINAEIMATVKARLTIEKKKAGSDTDVDELENSTITA